MELGVKPHNPGKIRPERFTSCRMDAVAARGCETLPKKLDKVGGQSWRLFQRGRRAFHIQKSQVALQGCP